MSLFLIPLRPPAVALLVNGSLPTFKSQAFSSSREGGGVLLGRHSLFAESQGIHSLSIRKSRELPFACFYDTKKDLDNGLAEKRLGANWPILSRWDVPWEWQTVLFSMIACGASFALTGLVEAVALPYLGFQGGEVILDQKAEILFAGQFAVTASVLGVLYGITNTFRPFPNDIFHYDLKEPFDLQKGWLLWAGVGLFGAVIAIALVGFLLNIMNSEQPQRETDALIRLLPLIGSSSISTACLVGITGVLAPLLEETVFRGFLMVSLTKWFPTPVSVLLSAAVFALAHLTPGEFPQLFVLGNNTAEIDHILTQLNSRFTMKHLGTAHSFLGIQIARTTEQFFLSQQPYARSLLQLTSLSDCNPLANPTCTKLPSTFSNETLLSDPTVYRRITGSLQYLTLTRPDIAFSVNVLSQHMHHPQSQHVYLLKRLLRYIKGTIDYGIPITKSNLCLTSFSDADWAGDPISRKSTSGYCSFLGDTIISWSVKKQTTVARSSTESEYRALAALTADILWLRRILTDFGIPQTQPTELYCDNTSAIALANSPVFHARTNTSRLIIDLSGITYNNTPSNYFLSALLIKWPTS